ncbi:MAG: hypothetical protein HY689_02910 [Chloroflexi bacterium]|nr:hypothetical protein [Chloroflexota bacterium]
MTPQEFREWAAEHIYGWQWLDPPAGPVGEAERRLCPPGQPWAAAGYELPDPIQQWADCWALLGNMQQERWDWVLSGGPEAKPMTVFRRGPAYQGYVGVASDLKLAVCIAAYRAIESGRAHAQQETSA